MSLQVKIRYVEVEKIVEMKLKNTYFLGDPENKVVNYLPDLVMGKKTRYPNGMVQRAELVFHKDRPILWWVKHPVYSILLELMVVLQYRERNVEASCDTSGKGRPA